LKRSWEFPDDQRHLSRRPVGRIPHRRIAQLAADGLTNRTVGAHLAKIYAKLGATSRVQLHSALSTGQEP
jgi:hypothetical protein